MAQPRSFARTDWSAMEKARSPEAEREYEVRFPASLICGGNQKIQIPSFPFSLLLFPPFSNTQPDLSFELESGEGSSSWGNTIRKREMFGRVRASPSPSPLDSLETPPSKIIKDDSLSIYEATLMKLKLGSQRHLISPPTVAEETDCASETVRETTSDLSSEAMNVEATFSSGPVSRSCQDISSDEEAMVIDTDCSSATVSDSSSDCQSTGNLNSQKRSEGMSILYMFSKFKAYQRTPTISHGAMMIENDGSASSSSCSECQSLSSAKDQWNHESSTISSFPQLS